MPGGSWRPLVLGGVLAVLVVVLVMVLTRSGPVDKDPALAAVDRLELKKNVAGLVDSTKNARADVACRALVALANVSGKSARPQIEAALTDPRPEVKKTAIAQMEKVLDYKDATPLVDLYKKETSLEVKQIIAGSLGNLRAWDGLQVLIPAMESRDDGLRMTAFRSVSQIVGLRLNVRATPAERQRLIAQLKTELPKYREAYDYQMSRLEKKQQEKK